MLTFKSTNLLIELDDNWKTYMFYIVLFASYNVKHHVMYICIYQSFFVNLLNYVIYFDYIK